MKSYVYLKEAPDMTETADTTSHYLRCDQITFEKAAQSRKASLATLVANLLFVHKMYSKCVAAQPLARVDNQRVKL